jgi:hypothetical protein
MGTVVLVTNVETATVVFTVAWVSAHGLPTRPNSTTVAPDVVSEPATSGEVLEPAEGASAVTLVASCVLHWSLPAVAVGRGTHIVGVASDWHGHVGPGSSSGISSECDLSWSGSRRVVSAAASAEEEPAGASWVLPRVAASVHVVAVLVLVAQSTAASRTPTVITEASSEPVVAPSLHGRVVLVPGQPSVGPVLARVPVASMGTMVLVSKVDTSTIVLTVAWVSAHGLPSRSDTSAPVPHVSSEVATSRAVHEPAESTSASTLSASDRLEWSLPAVAVGRETKVRRVASVREGLVGPDSVLEDSCRFRDLFRLASYSLDADALASAEEEPAGASWVLPRVAASVHVVAVLVLVAQSTAAVGVEAVSTEAPSCPVVTPSLHGCVTLVEGQPSSGPVLARVPVASVGSVMLVSKVETATIVATVARVSAHGLESRSKTSAVAPNVVAESATGSSVRDSAESTSLSALSAAGWLEWSLPAVAVGRGTRGHRVGCDWPAPVVGCTVKSDLSSEGRWGA